MSGLSGNSCASTDSPSLSSLLPKPRNVVAKDKEEVLLEVEETKLNSPEETEANNLEMAKSTSLERTTTATIYDLIARVGHGPDRQVQTQLSDLKPKHFSEEQLQRPSAEEVAEETEATRQALQQLVREKTAKTQPKAFSAERRTEIIRYTSEADGSTRMVKMVEAPQDPLEPAKFHHKRIPRPPPSPPAPRLHSPPRKVTAEEQKEWFIPPCISSWKNPKGYTVPLDKRLAADGRGLEEKTINNRISDLAEALFLAERHNRQEVEMRAVVERKVQEQERKRQDEKLRQIAEQARLQAQQLAADIERAARNEEALLGDVDTGMGLTIRERERIRRDLDYERDREMRLSRLPPEQRAALLERETNRDISEKIALGIVQPTSKDTLFDPRLFDRTEGVGAGMGGGEDDLYNLYDKPLFSGSTMHMIYKAPGEQSRPEKGFSGTEGVAPREGPVQFERAPTKTVNNDPFGVDQFLSEAKKGKRTISSSDHHHEPNTNDPKHHKPE